MANNLIWVWCIVWLLKLIWKSNEYKIKMPFEIYIPNGILI